MKNRNVFLSTLIILLITFSSSCKKAHETLKKDQLSRAWVISTYKKNDIDETATFKATLVNYTIIFNDQGNYSNTYTFLGVPVGINGTYAFENNEQQIRLTESGGTQHLFTINELTASKCTVTSFGTDKEQFFLVAK